MLAWNASCSSLMILHFCQIYLPGTRFLWKCFCANESKNIVRFVSEHMTLWHVTPNSGHVSRMQSRMTMFWTRVILDRSHLCLTLARIEKKAWNLHSGRTESSSTVMTGNGATGTRRSRLGPFRHSGICADYGYFVWSRVRLWRISLQHHKSYTVSFVIGRILLARLVDN